MNSFRRELDRNPSKLDLPVKIGLSTVSADQSKKKNGTETIIVGDNGTNGNADSVQGSQNQLTLRSTRIWLPTLIMPYVPNLSERLRSLASRYGVRSWFTYGGKIGDSVCQFKDKLHFSKS